MISLELAIAVSNYAHIIRTLSELGDSHTWVCWCRFSRVRIFTEWTWLPI